MKVIIYFFPRLLPIIGSVWGVLLLVRTCWHFKGKPFYKFFNPCDHFLYRVGDSWSEELSCTKNILRATFKKCGTKIKRGQNYNLLECGWILYYSGGSGMTYFLPNYPKMLTLDIPNEILKKYFPHFLDWKIKNPNPEKWNCKIQILNIQNTNFGHPYIQESTQVSTQIITQEKEFSDLENEIINNSILEKEKSSAQKENVILTFQSSGFRKVWEAWKEYRLEAHSFKYSTKSETAALHPLSNYNEKYAIELIRRAIESQWKKFHFPETPQDYEKWCKVQEKSNNNSINLNDEIYEQFK